MVHASLATSMDDIFLNFSLATPLNKASKALLLKFATLFVASSQSTGVSLGLIGKGGKSKNLALKGIEEKIKDFKDENESEDEDEDEDDDEDKDLTFITDEIIKLLQFKKKDKGKPPRKSKSLRKGKNEKPLIQCIECKG